WKSINEGVVSLKVFNPYLLTFTEINGKTDDISRRFARWCIDCQGMTSDVTPFLIGASLIGGAFAGGIFKSAQTVVSFAIANPMTASGIYFAVDDMATNQGGVVFGLGSAWLAKEGTERLLVKLLAGRFGPLVNILGFAAEVAGFTIADQVHGSLTGKDTGNFLSSLISGAGTMGVLRGFGKVSEIVGSLIPKNVMNSAMGKLVVTGAVGTTGMYAVGVGQSLASGAEIPSVGESAVLWLKYASISTFLPRVSSLDSRMSAERVANIRSLESKANAAMASYRNSMNKGDTVSAKKSLLEAEKNVESLKKLLESETAENVKKLDKIASEKEAELKKAREASKPNQRQINSLERTLNDLNSWVSELVSAVDVKIGSMESAIKNAKIASGVASPTTGNQPSSSGVVRVPGTNLNLPANYAGGAKSSAYASSANKQITAPRVVDYTAQIIESVLIRLANFGGLTALNDYLKQNPSALSLPDAEFLVLLKKFVPEFNPAVGGVPIGDEARNIIDGIKSARAKGVPVTPVSDFKIIGAPGDFSGEVRGKIRVSEEKAYDSEAQEAIVPRGVSATSLFDSLKSQGIYPKYKTNFNGKTIYVSD
ncbi:MAG: hypothetical protein WCP89_04410, partial [archaeon]